MSRRALVTGGASGLGRALTELLVARGDTVLVVDLADERPDTVPEGAAYRRLDVRSQQDWDAALAQVRDTWGGLDLLVNNAGIEKPFELVDMPLEEWEKVIAVNLTGTFLCTREAARIMRADGARGAIVMISSVHEVIPWRRFSHYCASKGGMKLFTQSVAYELAPHGIRVVSIAPGAVATPINEDVLENPEERRKVEEEVPLGRWGEVSDVADAVAWVSSERAAYVVGTTIFVDGGMTLYPKFV
jgi:glucose 1-dehydrogenase